jgi:DNA-binding beta-propeller fold protein YncE
VYVADYDNNRVQKFDSKGNSITNWGTQGTENGQVKKPQGITLDSSGKMYVKDVGNTGFRYLLQMPVIR